MKLYAVYDILNLMHSILLTYTEVHLVTQKKKWKILIAQNRKLLPSSKVIIRVLKPWSGFLLSYDKNIFYFFQIFRYWSIYSWNLFYIARGISDRKRFCVFSTCTLIFRQKNYSVRCNSKPQRQIKIKRQKCSAGIGDNSKLQKKIAKTSINIIHFKQNQAKLHQKYD